ncbi:hypothetical protein [Xylanimonas protaetiae]|uniref:Uncharacterized protein n=1 Tax=Xylanimonas protaetiae TaxID=2509457 RepID=A0A4V0YG48_9MICO|nr:hypothetical protein [Xylanimonas protaetiae]QAY69961.1 hypothetical protein ET471_07890 [Xylanimonas protaetiae]
MRTTFRTTAAAALAALALAGCSAQIGDVVEIPDYTPVEADGVQLDILDGMTEANAPAGFSTFWQSRTGTSRVSIGIATDADASGFVADQLASLGTTFKGFESTEGDDGSATFSGTGVDGDEYTGIVAVRGTTGVVMSAGPGVSGGVLQHVVDSIEPSDARAADAEPADDAHAADTADDADTPETTTVYTDDDSVMVDVLRGMEKHPSDAYDGLWQTPAGQDPQVTVSVQADADASFLQEQAAAISHVMTDTVELDASADRYVFSGTGVDGKVYTVVVGVNDGVGVVASGGPGLDEQVLRDIADSAF